MRKIVIAVGLGAILSGMFSVCLAAPVRVTGTKVEMEKPAGFVAAPNFSGFAKPGTQVSIMVTEVPGPYSKVTAGFTDELMKPRGMKLLSKTSHPQGAFSGVLVNLEQAANGKTYGKWINAFGDESKTVMVTGTFPKAEEGTYNSMMKAAVSAAKYNSKLADVDPQADLPFSIKGTADLKYAGRLQNLLMYTSDGQMGTAGSRHRTFVIGQALNDVETGDNADFARKRLQQLDSVSELKILEEKDLPASGLPGREITATGRARDGEQVCVYQHMIFGLGSYIISQGIAPASDREKAVADFKSIMTTFKLK